MNYQLNTRLDGNIAMTSRFHGNERLQQDKTLYRFLWVQNSSLAVEVDHVPMRLTKGEITTPTPSHHSEMKEVEGEYLALVFNSNFCCIFGYDDEVSCNDILFYGSSQVTCLELSKEQSFRLYDMVHGFCWESAVGDSFQEEMLRITLKRFVITCTRITHAESSMGREHEKAFDIIRQFYVLVDGNFREEKQVQDCIGIFCRSPKTLSNLFSACGLPSSLRVIHEWIEAEAKRLLLYTRRSAKEIGDILGFEDLVTFSRFSKKMTGEYVSEYRKRVQREELPTVTE